MVIALGSDHAGLPLKKEIMGLLDSMNIAYKDFGTYTSDSCDYAKFGQLAANAVVSGECDRGIRCVVCSDCFSAKMSREHNDANMLALGARVVGSELAMMIVRIWLEAEFAGGRHQRRVDQIMAIEAGETL